jgi:hypothetical protein
MSMISVSRAKQPTGVGELSEPATDVGTGVLCLVPKEVPADVIACLDQHFAGTGVAVKVTQGRRRDRRGGDDRRHGLEPTSQMGDRRFAPDLEGRRFWERRGDFEQIEAPILPAVAMPYADKLRFVRRRPRGIDDTELTRLRAMVTGWRERAREHESESTGLLKSMVGLVEDLRSLRTMTPRWFLAVRRGEQAIESYRERRLTR